MMPVNNNGVIGINNFPKSVKGIELHVSIHVTKLFKLRLKIASILFKIASWVLRIPVEIVYDDGMPYHPHCRCDVNDRKGEVKDE